VYINTYALTGRHRIIAFGPNAVIGQTFYGPTLSTDYIYIYIYI